MYRAPAIGMHAMVSSGNALASIVGLRVMMDGGNAIDATIATNAALQVTSPFVCGMGGDLFALVYEARTGKVHGFNGSGRAPAAMTMDFVRGLGHEKIPFFGALTVTVPGCVDAWAQLHERFGRASWADLFRPAVAYAREGHPVGRSLAGALGARKSQYAPYRSWQETFAPNGMTATAGEVWRQDALAESLERVASEGRDGLYQGELARRIVAEVRAEGGVMTEADLVNHRGEWSEPVQTTYRGHTVYETAPNSQGMTALIALNMLDEVDLAKHGPGTAETLRYLIEAAKLAYADRDRHLTDPAFTDIPTDWLLSKERTRGALARGETASHARLSTAGDTTSFCVVDPEGNAVSCIQSNYAGFGSGLAVGGFGLQNRGAYFSLDPSHVNRLEPGKRTLHTIMAAMVMAGEKPWILFGAVGGDTQPVTHLQGLTNIIDFGMNVQEAIEAPRFVLGVGADTWDATRDQLWLEGRFDPSVADGLRAMGYEPGIAASLPGRPGFGGAFGLAQAVVIDPVSGARFGGADPRWDAYAIGY